MPFKILSTTNSSLLDQYRPALEEIFFEASSLKNFRDHEHKDSFFERWLGVYLRLYPDQFFLAIDNSDEQNLLGYLCFHTKSPLPGAYQHPGTEAFLDLYHDYPVHLHINCHHQSRGLGVGQALVQKLFEKMRELKLEGVHLITSADQRNVEFYQKMGFHHVVEREHGKMILLWMGKKI